MPVSIEERVKGTELFFGEYLRGYRERVNKFYKEEYTNHPSYFPLMNPVMMKALHLQNQDSIFLFVKSSNDQLESVVASEEQMEKYTGLSEVPKLKQDDYIVSLLGFTKKDVSKKKYISELGRFSLNFFDQINHHLIPEESFKWGQKEADWDFNAYQLDEAIKNLSKPSTNYSLFDIDSVINKVIDEQFRYEFEETIKAYNAELYLASTITAGVTIESLLKNIIIDRLGKQSLPQAKNSYILNYTDILVNKGVMSERLQSRIKSANTLRNSSGHSKSGKMEAADAEYLISVIKSIVDELF